MQFAALPPTYLLSRQLLHRARCLILSLRQCPGLRATRWHGVYDLDCVGAVLSIHYIHENDCHHRDCGVRSLVDIGGQRVSRIGRCAGRVNVYDFLWVFCFLVAAHGVSHGVLYYHVA